MAVRALRLHPADEVANLLERAEAGTEVAVYDGAGRHQVTLVAREEVPFGHKVAIQDLLRGAVVCKYGQPIGRLTADVPAGGYVHVQNLQSLVGAQAPVALAAPRPARFTAGALMRFAEAAARAAGALPAAARDLAEAMVEADMRGVETHGLRRLRPYVERLRSGAVDGAAQPVVSAEGSVVQVDGKNAPGHHVACVAADAVAALALERDVAVGVVRESNHFGFAGYYAARIAAQGMVGIVTSNGAPCVAPPGGRTALFSNDPLAIAVPFGDGFVEMDLATSVTSRARLQQALERGEHLPRGWALDPDGLPTEDPALGLAGTVLPMAGERGFALLFALEILAGLLPGGAAADEVRAKDRDLRPERTSHFFFAIRLGGLPRADSFGERLSDLVLRMREAPRRDGAPPPRYPGERRWALRAERLARGVPLDPIIARELMDLAADLGISFPGALEVDA